MQNPEYFIVTGRTLDSTQSRIVSFELRPVQGNAAGEPFKASWADVARSILDGVRFVSATWNMKTEKWVLGAVLEVVVKTEQDNTAFDNLLNLPAVA